MRIKLLALVVSLFFLSTFSHAVGEGIDGCSWGIDCGDNAGTRAISVAYVSGVNTFNGLQAGNYCFVTDRLSPDSRPLTCTDYANMGMFGSVVTERVTIQECAVFHGETTGWESGDLMELQVVAIEEGVPPTKYTMGDTFTIKAPADSCAGATNCADATGIFRWVVNGTSTVTDAVLAIEITGTTTEVGNNGRVRMSFDCAY
jgi:hypothetical protein